MARPSHPTPDRFETPVSILTDEARVSLYAQSRAGAGCQHPSGGRRGHDEVGKAYGGGLGRGIPSRTSGTLWASKRGGRA